MNLIEKLGLEKCKQIVDGAPEGAQLFKTHFNLVGYAKLQTHFVYMATTTFKNGFGDKAVWKIMGCRSVLKFKPRKFKKLNDLRTAIQQQLQIELNNCSEKDSSEISITDHCTDISNHISPRTIVWDLASGEDWSVEIDR